MWEKVFKDKLGPLTLRLAVGLVGIYHGYSKIMAEGGTDWAPGLGLGWQLLIAWGEFGAGLAILLGVRCRIAAGVLLLLSGGTFVWWQGWNVTRLPLSTLEPAILLFLSVMALLFLGAGDLAFGQAGGRGAGRAVKKK